MNQPSWYSLSHSCFYSGIKLVRTGDVYRVDQLTKEHLINQISPIRNFIVHENKHENINIVAAAGVINNGIAGFILPMKVRLKELYKSFVVKEPLTPRNFISVFKQLRLEVLNEFSCFKGINDSKKISHIPYVIEWELITLKKYFPAIKIDEKFNTKLISEFN